ncbi:hypothetical protein [Motiliproteus sediminis]|uniref:hypothetical protein n=1 Tax=Motiliproteus sediminis TaxID=1468178 RepID=UPI001AEFE9DB|nr:hypothetical protein [Motiliproteus sediminis]
MLPKRFYEALPYLYIVSALAVMAFTDGGLVYLFAAILYACGAAVWVMRSSYRRKTSPALIRNRKGFMLFPAFIYEYLPFIYLGVGVLVLLSVSPPWGVVPGIMLCLAGVLVWIIRAIYRSHSYYDVHA